MQFAVNTNTAEINHIKKTFSLDKLKQIDKSQTDIKNLSYEIEIIKI